MYSFQSPSILWETPFMSRQVICPVCSPEKQSSILRKIMVRFGLMLIAFMFSCFVFGQNGQTKRVAILEPVDKEGTIALGVKLMVRGTLTEAITATSGYEGYDRIDMASIWGEHDFQRTGMVSDADIKKLGQMASANYILIAELAYINSDYIVLTAKILDVETARVERAGNVQTRLIPEELGRNCKVLAGKILNMSIETGSQKGELLIDGNKYVGEYKDGKPHGKGKMTYAKNDEYNRKFYDGDWVDGNAEGQGTLVWKDGDRYEGEFENDMMEGQGTYYWADGRRYIGDFKNNVSEGYGIMYYSNGERYEGNWVNDKRQGNGTMYYAGEDAGNYEMANYQNGAANGASTYYFRNGNYAKRNWVNGELHGEQYYYTSRGVLYRILTFGNGLLIKIKNF